MILVNIRKEDRDLFLDMDPFHFLDRLFLPYTYAMAAVDDNQAKKTYAGIMVYQQDSYGFTVDWLCVGETYEKSGVGDQLLDRAFNMAREAGFDTIRAYIPQIKDRELFCQGEGRYMEEFYFKTKTKLLGEWYTDVKSLLSKRIYPGGLDMDHFKAMPLSQLPSRLKDQVFDYLESMKHRESLYPIKENYKLLDSDISTLIAHDGKIECALLVQAVLGHRYHVRQGKMTASRKTMLFPVYFSIGQPLATRYMMKQALKAASEKYPMESEVRAILSRDRYAPLADQLMENHVEASLLSARLEDYFDPGGEELDVLMTLGW